MDVASQCNVDARLQSGFPFGSSLETVPEVSESDTVEDSLKDQRDAHPSSSELELFQDVDSQGAAIATSQTAVGWTRRPRHGVMGDERHTRDDRVSALEKSFRGFAERKSVEIVNPCVGLTFDSIGEAYDYYNLYSWECGFGIRIENVPFTKRCLRTLCGKISKEQADDDVKKTMEIFSELKEKDSEFTYTVQVDAESRIQTLLWTNGRSKLQYHHFGDVVTFDTTYKTNLYDMPFGIFVGVNNHFQSVLYAGVLMRDEKIESFEWVFREFVKMMGGKKPITILTDQARAMEVAIENVFPGTTHRWCKWHVLRKAKEHLGMHYTKKSGFRTEFHNLVDEMLTVAEFEKGWQELVEKYGLVSNTFLIQVYEAGAVIKNNEPIERHASKIYTRAMFEMFGRALYVAGSYTVEEVEPQKKYIAVHMSPETRPDWYKHRYEVSVSADGSYYTCECGRFEHMGMICCHILKVLITKNVRKIPDKHIMKRWTVDARDILPDHIKHYQKDMGPPEAITFRHSAMYITALELVHMGDTNPDAFECVMSGLCELKQKAVALCDVNDGKSIVEKSRASSLANSVESRQASLGKKKQASADGSGVGASCSSSSFVRGQLLNEDRCELAVCALKGCVGVRLGSSAVRAEWPGFRWFCQLELRTRDFLGVGSSVASSSGLAPVDRVDEDAAVEDPDEFIVGDEVGRMPRSGRSTVNSSFAPKDLFDAVRGWSEQELDLVRAMGLAGLLLLDRFSHFNRDFSQFVLLCIDTSKSRLVLGKKRYADINEETFCRIVGARLGGSVEIQRTTGPPSPHEIYDARVALGLPGQTEISTYVLMTLLRTPRLHPLSDVDAARVKLAYGMLAISVFFSPRDRRAYIPRDAYLLAASAGDICNLNWGRYGVEELLDGAWRVQVSVSRHVRGGTVYGCLLAAQCLYFDNVATGTIGVDRSLVPRIGYYTAATLKALIHHDTLLLPSEKVYGMFRGIHSRASLLRNAPLCNIRRPSSEVRAGRSVPAGRVVEPLDPIDVACMQGVHRHEAPTVGSLLEGTVGVSETMQPDLCAEYENIVGQAGDWLRRCFSELDRNSRNREANFFRDLHLSGQETVKVVEAFERRERVVRLQGIQYLLNHLVERGVGKYVPSLEKHLGTVTGALSCIPGTSARVIDVDEFIGTNMSRGIQFSERLREWNMTSGGQHLSDYLTPPVPSMLAGVSYVSQHPSTPRQCLVASSAGVSHFSASARTGDVSLSDAGGLGGVCKDGWGSGRGLFFDDGTGLIPNEIGQNDDDMKMVGTDGFTTDKKEHGKEKMDCSYGNRQKRRSLSSILRVSEGLEYIVYTAKKKRASLDVAPTVGVEVATNQVGVPKDGPAGMVQSEAVVGAPGLTHVDRAVPVGAEQKVAIADDPPSLAYFEPNYVLVHKKRVVNRVPGVWPFGDGETYELPDICLANDGYMNMIFCKQEFMKKLWVVHTVPRLLKMSGFDILTEFHKMGTLRGKGFEIVRRLLNYVMSSYYRDDDVSRFGHCMPTKWMDIVMEGGDYSMASELRAMFTGAEIKFDIETCHVIWLPHRKEDGTYVVYGVDLSLEMIHVMDPMNTDEGRAVLVDLHKDTCGKILDGFIACADAFFDGWELDKSDWTYVYHAYMHAASSEEDTPWYVVHYILTFDGLNFAELPDKGILVGLRTQLMMMVLNMPGNVGDAPLSVKKPKASVWL
ncbi:hypothetical protein QYE76_020902 [Lolium multiflorum]|uniref:SWIM-type domain-containing protein n=1 Tax=Lolium multiflorum TaxID=4521 RepID=A0AAD8R728_LOLMU|nr:hypothetical protein QYE76_020902 [Lolium multiflorum]